MCTQDENMHVKKNNQKNSLSYLDNSLQNCYAHVRIIHIGIIHAGNSVTKKVTVQYTEVTDAYGQA